MSKVSIATAYEPVEVDLWGSTFTTVDATRSVAKKAGALQDKLAAAEDDDVAVKLLSQLLDLKLAGEEKPSTLIDAKWKADELSVRQLLVFLESLGEAENPTQEDQQP